MTIIIVSDHDFVTFYTRKLQLKKPKQAESEIEIQDSEIEIQDNENKLYGKGKGTEGFKNDQLLVN